ncbi:L-aspartate oxidase domain protein [Mycobacterium xenopi 4042]|uniref:L-aspartate oxidase domain protein n=1 Tax=Mycobacterium xenopi 4042 TaxID=1299334 RepID=X8DIJ4_MYCXE|nr:L-aspartate oxidase domain protein [Mycobacterium xenopi 4042]
MYLDARGIADFESRSRPSPRLARRSVSTLCASPYGRAGRALQLRGVVTDVCGAPSCLACSRRGVARTGMHGANRLASNSCWRGCRRGDVRDAPPPRTQQRSDPHTRNRLS